MAVKWDTPLFSEKKIFILGKSYNAKQTHTHTHTYTYTCSTNCCSIYKSFWTLRSMNFSTSSVLSPGACSNSCQLTWWCYLTISSSATRFSWSFSIRLSNDYSGLISFRIDWFGFLAVQGTLKSLLKQHSSKASIFQCSVFFYGPALTFIHDYGKNHSADYMDICWESDVSAF